MAPILLVLLDFLAPGTLPVVQESHQEGPAACGAESLDVQVGHRSQEHSAELRCVVGYPHDLPNFQVPVTDDKLSSEHLEKIDVRVLPVPITPLVNQHNRPPC